MHVVVSLYHRYQNSQKECSLRIAKMSKKHYLRINSLNILPDYDRCSVAT